MTANAKWNFPSPDYDSRVTNTAEQEQTNSQKDSDLLTFNIADLLNEESWVVYISL